MNPQNMVKYLFLTVGRLKFIDSFQFTPKGLDVLAKILMGDEFRCLRESCYLILVSSDAKVSIPMTIWIALTDLTRLNYLQDAFFSKLSGSPCSDSEYTHANRVRTAFGVGQWQITTTSTCSRMCYF